MGEKHEGKSPAAGESMRKGKNGENEGVRQPSSQHHDWPRKSSREQRYLGKSIYEQD
jgi:hypothetical protein